MGLVPTILALFGGKSTVWPWHNIGAGIWSNNYTKNKKVVHKRLLYIKGFLKRYLSTSSDRYLSRYYYLIYMVHSMKILQNFLNRGHALFIIKNLFSVRSSLLSTNPDIILFRKPFFLMNSKLSLPRTNHWNYTYMKFVVPDRCNREGKCEQHMEWRLN